MTSEGKYCLVIHGGCGISLTMGNTPEEVQIEAKETLHESLKAGIKVLTEGGSAVEAVVEAIKVMEDAPVFNAGKGSVYTTKFTNECDAGIMDGSSGKAGGVSTLKKVKNPILAAVEVMQNTPHAILCGDGAEEFALSKNIETVDPSYFETEKRRKQLEKMIKEGKTTPILDFDTNVTGINRPIPIRENPLPPSITSEGTVGAVALDVHGNLAGGSSTGGMTGKLPGRVSDSSIAGAGFFANSSVAFSATGNGDYFIRISACRRAADIVELLGKNLEDASNKVVKEELMGASAGLIAVSKSGEIAMPYNTPGMFRGYARNDAEPWVGIF